MDGISLGEFESCITSACAYSPIIIGVSTIAVGVTWLRLRAYLEDGSFLDTFYNATTGKTAFALI